MLPQMYAYSDAGRPPIDRSVLREFDTGLRDSRQYSPWFQREHHDWDYDTNYDNIRSKKTVPEAENHFVTQVTPHGQSGLGRYMHMHTDTTSALIEPGRPSAIIEQAYDPFWSEHRFVHNAARVTPRSMPVTIDPGSTMQNDTGDGEIQDASTRPGIRERGARDVFMQLDRDGLGRPAHGIGGVAEGYQEWHTAPVQWLADRQGIMQKDPTFVFEAQEWDTELY